MRTAAEEYYRPWVPNLPPSHTRIGLRLPKVVLFSRAREVVLSWALHQLLGSLYFCFSNHHRPETTVKLSARTLTHRARRDGTEKGVYFPCGEFLGAFVTRREGLISGATEEANRRITLARFSRLFRIIAITFHRASAPHREGAFVCL